jgi:uncharacterized UBP type Zn finger protein
MHEKGRQKKLAYAVDFGNDYSMVMRGKNDEEHTYSLRTVIYHVGNSMNEGHYIAVTRTGEKFGNWWQV